MSTRTSLGLNIGLPIMMMVLVGGATLCGADENKPPTTQEQALAKYFEGEVTAMEGQLERDIKTKEDWLKNKDEYRRQLAEMLGLDPMPARTDPKAVKTGEFEHEGIIVEKLHYQPLPGLYVTANLYRPKVVEKPLPTVLYVCGHSNVMKDGVSLGNKTGYEHHGTWYAKHGFVCLMIDTVQLGEIRGEHHGTYTKGRWWWMARGYTPAGVEAWSGIRGLDYLETRTEVDKSRFGVAGRSGGGAYSWFIAALDERIKVAAPTAGITTLRNHVVDGCVEGHCDCMFFVNTYRWDYDKLAALVAPRPLCILNTDKDKIFPIDGVFKVYQSTRRIYDLLDASASLGMQFAEGPHKDTQPLNTGEFHWMTRFLQNADPMSSLDSPAVKSISAKQLQVFTSGLPADEKNTKIDESFVAKAATAKVPDNAEQWTAMRDGWMKSIKEKCFPSQKEVITIKPPASAGETASVEGVTMHRYASQEGDLWLAHKEGLPLQNLELVVLNVLDEEGWTGFLKSYGNRFQALVPGDAGAESDNASFEQEKKMYQNFKWGMAYMCPRGIGPTAWDAAGAKEGAPTDVKSLKSEDKERIHRLRRYYLLGQTLHGQQVWDIRQALATLRSLEGLQDTKLWLQASRLQAGNALYASLFVDGITRLDLHELPHSHDQGPYYLNVLKYLDLPQAAAMASEATRVVIYDADKAAWDFPSQVSEKLGWGQDKKRGLQIRDLPKVAQ